MLRVELEKGLIQWGGPQKKVQKPVDKCALEGPSEEGAIVWEE